MKKVIRLTESQLTNIVKRILKEEYEKNFYVALSDMEEPGEVDAHLVSPDEYGKYMESDWDLRGPFTEQDANDFINKINDSNKMWRYYNSMDDREGKSNLYIDPLDKFEKDSLDANW